MAGKDKDPANARPEDVLIEALIQATGRTAQAVYEFDEFRLDVADERLSRGGVPVPLAPKEFERHGRLVTKQELLDRVWAGTFVGDDTIAQRISVLRKALGDSASQKYIETVPKRGYRFVGSVRLLGEAQ
jgi:DNA-binding winged helix-turn-helix (wHTH) protein